MSYTIQPTNDTTGIDTFVQDGTSADSNFGGNTGLQMGYRTATSRNSRILIKFDLSSIPPGAVVSSATLSIYMESTDESESGDRGYDIARVTADWSESTVTWNNQPSTAIKESTTTITANTTGYKDFTVTQMVTDWLNGTYSNYGAKIYNPSTGQAPHFNFISSGGASNQPKLVVVLSSSSSVSPSESRSTSASQSSSLSPSGSLSPSASTSASPSLGYTGYTRGDYATLPTNDNDLETNYSAQNITDVATNDNVRVGQTATQQYMIHQFKNFVSDNINWVLQWEGQSTLAPSSSSVFLQIYNRNGNVWENLDQNNTTGVNTDFSLTGSITSNASYYKSSTNVITCRVYQLAT
jgi:hypothetical protein